MEIFVVDRVHVLRRFPRAPQSFKQCGHSLWAVQPTACRPLVRSLVAWNVSKQCDEELHPSRTSGQHVAFRIPNVDALEGRDAKRFSCVQKGSGVRLAFRESVATHNHSRASPQGKPLQQGFGEPARLIRDNTPRKTFCVEFKIVVRPRQTGLESYPKSSGQLMKRATY